MLAWTMANTDWYWYLIDIPGVFCVDSLESEFCFAGWMLADSYSLYSYNPSTLSIKLLHGWIQCMEFRCKLG
jgi:hypothetical protein